jgi:hypothetical protein
MGKTLYPRLTPEEVETQITAQPSAADLDAHAAEQKVKEATDTEDAKAFELAAAINKGLGKS